MNKNLLLVGAVAVAGFFTLTAFGGKTLEQQQAEVKAAVDAKIAALRTEKQADCDSRVMAAAQTRYDEVEATRAAEMAAMPTTKGGKTVKGPRVKALPQPTKPKVDPQKTRPGAAKPGDIEQEKERSGAGKPMDAQQQKKRPGAAGGGN